MTEFIRPEAVEKTVEVDVAKELEQEDPASTLEAERGDTTSWTNEHEQKDLASTQELEQEDRLSDLPNDILHSILERLKLHEAARTSVLSRRWRHLFRSRSRIIIDIGAFPRKDNGFETAQDDFAQSNAAMIEATESMLAHTNQHPIRLLRLRFFLLEESIDIVRCVDKAMADREIVALHLVPLPEFSDANCTPDDKVTYGTRFMRSFYAGPRAFGGLSYLHMHCLKLSIPDMTNVLHTCKKLEYLSLRSCDYGYRSVLQIDHLQLSNLKIDCCKFETIELRCLPRLTVLTCQTWSAPRDKYPLSFGYVPQLSKLILSNACTKLHKILQLSEFLSNVMIGVMELDFQCEKIWIQPEAPKLLGPLLRNLQCLSLQRIHDECDLDWTMFFLEAAPLLKKIYIQVWDHTSCGYEEDEAIELTEIRQSLYEKKSNSLMWETPDDLKHYGLKELTIKGYQIEEKFTRYIRRVMQTSVNLELIILLDSRWCEGCRFSPSTRYPRTAEEKDLTRKQISQWRSTLIKIEIE